MSEIIEHVGLSAGAIYNHFSGKTAIMLAVANVDLSEFGVNELPAGIAVTAEPATEDLFTVAAAENSQGQNPDQQTGSHPDEKPWDFVLGWFNTLQKNPELCRLLLLTWAESVTLPELHTLVDAQLSALQDAALTRYRNWAEENLEFTATELEQWLDVIGAAVLSIFTGYITQSQTLSIFSHESYLEYAGAILTQQS